MKNTLDKRVLDLYQYIIDNGYKKEDRTGTGTTSVFGMQIRHKMSEGFPLLTTKKMHWDSIVIELLWFLRGDTNIQYLVKNGCNIWNGDAYKAYNYYHNNHPKIHSNRFDILSKTEFVEKIKTDDIFAKKWGELGPIYGKQWRNWESTHIHNYSESYGGISGRKYFSSDMQHTSIDQIANIIHDLKTNPDSRRMMVNAWNVGEIDKMTLPPCHYGFQVYTRELSLKERWDWLKSNTKGMLQWDRMNLPSHDWLNCVWLSDSFDSSTFEKTQDMGYVNVPKREISLMWNQRSVDSFLGLPFNIASYGLLLEILAKEVNMIPGELIGNLGDTHLYLNHIEQAKEQIERTSFELPTLNELPNYLGMKDDWELYTKGDFTLNNYKSHGTIKAPLSN